MEEGRRHEGRDGREHGRGLEKEDPDHPEEDGRGGHEGRGRETVEGREIVLAALVMGKIKEEKENGEDFPEERPKVLFRQRFLPKEGAFAAIIGQKALGTPVNEADVAKAGAQQEKDSRERKEESDGVGIDAGEDEGGNENEEKPSEEGEVNRF